jgi:hypothetical protein
VSTTIVYPSEFFTTTAANHLKKMGTNQFVPNPLAEAFLKEADVSGGGERVIIPFDVQEHSKTTQIVSGYEAADTDVQTVLVPGNDTWAFNIRPVIFSWVDDAKNKGRHEIISIVETRTENTKLALMQELERRLLLFQTIAAMSDINTLNGDDEAGGFIENTAVGSQNNVVHGISKATFAALPGFQNKRFDAAGDASANILPGARSVTNRIANRTKDPTKLRLYVSEPSAEAWGDQVQTFSRYGEGDADPIGLRIRVNGMMGMQVLNMPRNGTVTGVSDQEWSFLWIDHNRIKLNLLRSDLGFGMTPFRDVGGGHDSKLAFFRFGGQLTVSDWGSSGLLFGADTF